MASNRHHYTFFPLPAQPHNPLSAIPAKTSAEISVTPCPHQTPVAQTSMYPFPHSPPPAPRKLTPQKRKQGYDENMLPTAFSSQALHTSPVKRNVGWSLSDLLYHLFRLRDEKNDHVQCNHQHAAAVQQFLRGRTRFTPAAIIDAWLRSADGRLVNDSPERSLMYSTVVDYKTIKSVRPALTSFAVQLARTRLCHEGRDALRATEKPSKRHLQWGDIGSSTVATASAEIQQDQPLLWNFVTSYVVQKPILSNEDIPDKQRRPVAGACTHLITTLNYAAAPRSPKARLVPAMRGLLYFATSVPFNIFGFSSRIAHTPSYSTVFNMLHTLSLHEAELTSEIGRDPTKWDILRLDNVQNYLLQRDARIGRKNVMNIGIAATYFEASDHVTTHDIVSWMDLNHFEDVLTLQWLRVLADYIPELYHLKEHVSMLYRTHVSKIPLPPKATKMHPLATSSKNETVTTELKDALIDFFSQIDSFESGEIIESTLEWWHLHWTDLSRIFETHWGDLLGRDPSTLGYGATKIGRLKPPNLKKVDFYPGAELVYLTLDVHMLDCWRLHLQMDDIFKHFQRLSATNCLPHLEDLENSARLLYRTYSNAAGIHCAFTDAESSSEWCSAAPLGSPWTSDPDCELVAKAVATKETDGTTTKPKVRAIVFMQDALVSREMAYAVAEGDVGRAYEMIKHMLFTFAGSSHSKYMIYLLETLCNLELESSEELRLEILKQSLVNVTGKAGSFCAGDFIQEYLNHMLQAIVERKGMDYGDKYVREVVARNLHHFARIKLEVKQGEGLAQWSGCHAAPETRAEVQILLEEYQRWQLHLRRPGRSYVGPDEPFSMDDFMTGFNSLHSGRLASWVTESVYYRNLCDSDHITSEPLDVEPTDTDEDDSHMTDPTELTGPLAFMTMVNGEMLLVADDPSDGLETIGDNHVEMSLDTEGDVGIDWDVDTHSDGEV
ncbi:hypothetical protein PAXINDRAFT_16329 [Paxillus involutus ATCC 200175]|uniref:DUF6589 domain-containing protein n=1 Tax=Paxillus involutus ATCC 200175 TaxID=664439 RepID=A0A0C9TJ29_PAXIN|nr:hypothetical protein PAXINDRAFT_16329 [Paxillus involutus ATCC 200175]